MPEQRTHGETTLSTEHIFDGKLLQVYRDQIETSDGKTSVREWINHMGAAAVVPLFDDGTTLLVKQFRYPHRSIFLEVPAGKLDVEGEQPADVAARELEEETGWIPRRLTALGAFSPCIGYSNEEIHLFIGEDLVEGYLNFSEGEFIETIRLPFTKAVEMARRGEIRDMKTVTALFLTRAALDRRQQESGAVD